MAAKLAFVANASSGRTWTIGADSVPAPISVRDLDGTFYVVRLSSRRTPECIAEINLGDHILSVVDVIEAIDESGDQRLRLPELAGIASSQFEAVTGYMLTIDLFGPDGTPVPETEAESTGDPF